MDPDANAYLHEIVFYQFTESNSSMIFLIGKEEKFNIQKKIFEESQQHKDILQVHFQSRIGGLYRLYIAVSGDRSVGWAVSWSVRNNVEL